MVEGSPHGSIRGNPAVPGYDDETIGYHAFLMQEAGLVAARTTSHLTSPSPAAVITGLTSAGHDFLDNARDPARWEKAKSIANQAGAWSLEILKQILG